MASLWFVTLRGNVTPEVRAALEHARMPLTGLGHEVGVGSGPGEVSQSIRVEARTADEAVTRAREILDGLPVYVDETARPLGSEAE